MSQLIHRFIPAPGSHATVLLLHEEGANENDLIPIGRAVAKGAALLSPRLPAAATEVTEFVAQAARQYGFDLAAVYALGYSSGADLAAALLLQSPRVLAGAVLLRGRLPRQLQAAPDLQGIQVMMLAGQHDPVARPEDTEELARTLTSAGAMVEVHWMNEGHELGPDDFQAAAKWLSPKLK